MLISLAQCSQRPIDIIEELDAISIDCAKNGYFFDSRTGKEKREIARDEFFFVSLTGSGAHPQDPEPAPGPPVNDARAHCE